MFFVLQPVLLCSSRQFIEAVSYTHLDVYKRQFLVLGLALCLIFSALGFKRVEYFVSLGYAASVTAQAIAFPFLYRETIRGLALLQSGMLLAYGLRPVSYTHLDVYKRQGRIN